MTQVVEGDPSIIYRTLSLQLRKLIIEPCQKTIRSPPGRPLVIVIDGLDECEGRNIQQEILRSIWSVIHQGSLPLRFLVASRLESHIHEIFMGVLHRIHCRVNINQSFEADRLTVNSAELLHTLGWIRRETEHRRGLEFSPNAQDPTRDLPRARSGEQWGLRRAHSRTL
jgi:hypothetical protein